MAIRLPRWTRDHAGCPAAQTHSSMGVKCGVRSVNTMTQNGTRLWQKPEADGIRLLPTGPQAPQPRRHILSKNRRQNEGRKEKVDEEKRKRPPVPNWCYWTSHKLHTTHIHALQSQTGSCRSGQTAASGEMAGWGQGRVTHGGGCWWWGQQPARLWGYDGWPN